MGDAFEKLAGLVGASVEAAPGQGLPRTRAEALAIGVKWYFTGLPCKHGHVAGRRVSTRACVECERQHEASLERKESKRQYTTSPKHREYRRQYNAKPEIKGLKRQCDARPEAKVRKRQYVMARTGDAVLFAINQAERAAVSARAPTDIVPQCPEPHRSQLQALIDRIRQDPNAGKAVIALLRTMRELRKTELAQQRAAESTTAAESNT